MMHITKVYIREKIKGTDYEHYIGASDELKRIETFALLKRHFTEIEPKNCMTYTFKITFGKYQFILYPYPGKPEQRKGWRVQTMVDNQLFNDVVRKRWYGAYWASFNQFIKRRIWK